MKIDWTYLTLDIVEGQHAIRISGLGFDSGAALSWAGGAEPGTNDSDGSSEAGCRRCGNAVPIPRIHFSLEHLIQSPDCVSASKHTISLDQKFVWHRRIVPRRHGSFLRHCEHLAALPIPIFTSDRFQMQPDPRRFLPTLIIVAFLLFSVCFFSKPEIRIISTASPFFLSFSSSICRKQ